MFNYHKDIKSYLNRVYHTPVGKSAQRVEVLSCFLNGLLAKGESDLSVLAGEMPAQTTFASRVKQLTTWLKSGHNNWRTLYLPCLEQLLTTFLFQNKELVFIIDGTDIGNGCTALMLSLVYQKRAIPICWLTRKGKKGHLPTRLHLELLNQLQLLIHTQPVLQEKKIVLLGDGEFDSGELTASCKNWGWHFVVRTANNTLIHTYQGDTETTTHFHEVTAIAHKKGEDDGHFWLFLPDIHYTEKRWGAVNAVFWHDKKYEKPLFLLTNFELAFDAYDYYKKRFAIETLFGDLKSRGFNVHKSSIGDPKMLDRLLIAVSIACLITWNVAKAHNAQKIKKMVTPAHKNDLSIFQFGKRIWQFCLKNAIKIVLSLSMNIEILII